MQVELLLLEGGGLLLQRRLQLQLVGGQHAVCWLLLIAIVEWRGRQLSYSCGGCRYAGAVGQKNTRCAAFAFCWFDDMLMRYCPARDNSKTTWYLNLADKQYAVAVRAVVRRGAVAGWLGRREVKVGL